MFRDAAAACSADFPAEVLGERFRTRVERDHTSACGRTACGWDAILWPNGVTAVGSPMGLPR